MQFLMWNFKGSKSCGAVLMVCSVRATVVLLHWWCPPCACWYVCGMIPQCSAMDVSVQITMKGAAKCDDLCELQNSVNQ